MDHRPAGKTMPLAFAGITEEIEAVTGKPVITRNQALARDALRLAGIDDRIAGYGRLFAVE